MSTRTGSSGEKKGGETIPKEVALGEIAQQVEGQIIGNPALRICGVNAPENAKEGELTFVSDPSYKKKVQGTAASAILCKKGMTDFLPKKTLLVVENVRYALSQILSFFHPPRLAAPGVDRRAVIGEHVLVGENVSIGPCVVIENHVCIGNGVHLFPGVFVGQESEIGEDTLLYPHVTIYERVRIGKRVIIHAGTVIGADGFGFTTYQSQQVKIPQVGSVEIEDDVELGANVTVDRATLGRTRIGRGTKVDDQVHIGHNVDIGPHCLIVAQVGIAGTVRMGHHVTLAGQVGVADHVTIGEGAIVGTRSVVTRNIRAHEKVFGFPPLPYQKGLAAQASLQYLPQLRETVKALSKKVEQCAPRRQDSP